jgi:hypothetical protein
VAGKVKEPAVDRFMRFVEVAPFGECWIWMGSRRADGYGQMALRNRPVLAHRFAYAHFAGDVPAGMNVLHRCDCRECVNPAHLFLGSHKDNAHDCIAKGRARKARGEAAGKAKLRADQVLQIRAMANTTPISEIARTFAVHQKSISKIISGESWRHL